MNNANLLSTLNLVPTYTRNCVYVTIREKTESA